MGKRYYFANVAFSTPSGLLHIGHALGQVAAHVTALYAQQTEGRTVFMPFGIHATGKDLLKIIGDIQNGVNPEKFGVDEQTAQQIQQAQDNETVDILLEHYRAAYAKDLETLGITIEKDSFFSTSQPIYHTFTQWTIRQLQKKGLVVTTKAPRPYCADCDDIKAIERDQSEVRAIGPVNWNDVRVDENGIYGGRFACRIHKDKPLEVILREEPSIDYGNEKAQEKTIQDVQDFLKTYPSTYKSELPEIIRTRKAKPMERSGEKNLGTPSPINEGNVIEALGDSNIYMEFFGIAYALKQGWIRPQHLTDTLYDHIFLGEGTSQEVAEKLGITRQDLGKVTGFMNDLLPLDLNVAGFEHKEVHFPFSLYTHAVVLGKEMFPREYILTSHVMMEGEKMSKSKGNVLCIADILDQVREFHIEGISEAAKMDTVRFFLMNYQTMDRDLDWKDSEFKNAGLGRVRKYVNIVNEVQRQLAASNGGDFGEAEHWLQTKIQRAIDETTKQMDERNYRKATIKSFDMLTKAISTYATRLGGKNQSVVDDALKKQWAMLQPFMPRLTAELADKHYQEPVMQWPKANGDLIFPEDHEAIEYKLQGPRYVKEKIGFIVSKIGQMRGRKLIQPGEEIQIVVPSELTKNLLDRETIKPLNGLPYHIDVDTATETMYIKHAGVEFR